MKKWIFFLIILIKNWKNLFYLQLFFKNSCHFNVQLVESFNLVNVILSFSTVPVPVPFSIPFPVQISVPGWLSGLNGCFSSYCVEGSKAKSYTTVWYYFLCEGLVKFESTSYIKENRYRATLCGDLRFVLNHVLETRESLRFKIGKCSEYKELQL